MSSGSPCPNLSLVATIGSLRGQAFAILLLLLGKEGLRIRASLAPSARAKHNAVELDLDEVLIKGVSAKGKRVANRTVRRVTDITGAPRKTPPVLQELPGLMPANKEESEEG
jgi:topoisomerase IV subunit A